MTLTVAYLSFCLGRRGIILCSSSAFKVKGLKLRLQKLLHRYYIHQWVGIDPLRKYATGISLISHSYFMASLFRSKSTFLFITKFVYYQYSNIYFHFPKQNCFIFWQPLIVIIDKLY